MVRITGLLIILASFFSLTAPAKASGDITLQYGRDSQEIVDVYRAEGSAKSAIVVIHGGGFVSGDKAGALLAWACRHFAQRGVACFSINYKLLRRYDKTTRGNAQFIEAQLALRWVRANAARFGIDPRKVCAWGISAGAYYAAMLATNLQTVVGTPVDDPLMESKSFPQYSSHANCAVLISTPIDLNRLTNPILERLFTALLSDTPSYKRNPEEALKAASPLSYVDSHTAPMYVIQGKLDPFLPPATQSTPFVEALKSQNVPVQYTQYQGGHSFCIDASVPCRKLMQGPVIYSILDKAAAWVHSVER